SAVDGKRMLIKGLSHKKVLVVLYDVDALSQLDALAGSLYWFGKGSIIVITTRDEHVLGMGCEFYPHIVTKVLELKSLITISNECLGMHDLIQEMGKDIVCRMQTNELGRRTRLWEPHDIVEVLKENTVTLNFP
ncbi:TMV resistance protein N-like protein, partial [Tanacetum coccineum]